MLFPICQRFWKKYPELGLSDDPEAMDLLCSMLHLDRRTHNTQRCDAAPLHHQADIRLRIAGREEK